MCTNRNILIFTIVILYNVTPNIGVDRIPQSPTLDQDFVTKYRENKLLDCYDLKITTRYAICEYIFTNLDLYSKYGYPIYSNRNAASAYYPSCEKHELSFESLSFNNEMTHNEYGKIESAIFPCFGRHEPMRTYYNGDDAVNYFYASRGAIDTEFYIFRREMHFDDEYDSFVLIQGIKNLDINTLEVLDLKNKDLLKQELQTLTQLSCNQSIEEIEIHFLRETDRSLLGLFCDLPSTIKFMICKLIVNYPRSALHNTVLFEEDFSAESTKCVTKSLHFKFAVGYSSPIMLEMFPCYFEARQSNELRPWYVVKGYRKSSALVFMEYDQNDDKDDNDHEGLVQFYEFYENTGITEMIKSH